MDYIIVSGAKPYDGRYEFNLGVELTTREWGWIKRLAGYLPATLDDDNAFSDPELVCVLAAIAMRRAGRIQPQEVPAVFERMADAPFGTTITIEAGQQEEAEEGDAGPPARSSNGSEPTSGPASPTSSETSEPTQQLYGIPDLDTSAPDQPTSVT